MKFIVIALMVTILLQGCAAQSKSQLINGSMETVVTEKLRYYLYYPEDYKVDSLEQFPLLLFLHGGGESGDSLVYCKKERTP